MRRDTNEAIERLDHIHRCERQLRRWLQDPPLGAAEEDYDALHTALRAAEQAISSGYRLWHALSAEPARAVPAPPEGMVPSQHKEES